MQRKTHSVYILASLSRRLYIGRTSDLLRRVWQHRREAIDGFTRRYRIHRLVYYEQTPNARAAIERERELKGWARTRKIELIESCNAGWLDLAADWFPRAGE
jgi:putative endonuclease